MINWETYCHDKSSEEAHQIALFGWCAENVGKYPELKWLFHIPNGGQRNKAEAGRLKAAGVKPGVPDICLPVPMPVKSKDYFYHGCFIELKIGKNKPSEEQNKWIIHLTANGYYVAVCYGWKDAREQILKYLGYNEK